MVGIGWISDVGPGIALGILHILVQTLNPMSKSAGWLSPFNGQPPRLSRGHHLRPEMWIPIFYYFCNVTRFGDDAASFACRSDTGDDNESSKWPRDTCQANRAHRRSTINTRQFRLPRPPSIPTCLISS